MKSIVGVGSGRILALVVGLLFVKPAEAAGVVGLEVSSPGPSVVPDITLDLGFSSAGGDVTGLVTSGFAEASLNAGGRIRVRYQRNDDAIGVFATEQSSVVFPPTPGAVGGGLTVLDVFERAIGDAIALHSEEQAEISFRGRATVDGSTNGDTIVAKAAGNSRIILDGVVEATQGGNGDTIGLLLSENSRAVWTGMIDLSEEGNGETFLADVGGAATAILMGTGSIESNGNGDTFGVRAQGESHVTFNGDVAIRSSIHRDAILLDVSNESHVRFNGRLIAPANGNFNAGNKDISPIRMSDTAQLQIEGGELLFASARGRGVVNGGPQPVELRDIELRDQASLFWSGGTLEVTSLGSSVIPTFLVEDVASLTIRGSAFNRPLGEVSGLTGGISGVLLDGTPFAVNFERALTATIILVPEPGAGLLASSLLPLALAVRRGRL